MLLPYADELCRSDFELCEAANISLDDSPFGNPLLLSFDDDDDDSEIQF